MTKEDELILQALSPDSGINEQETEETDEVETVEEVEDETSEDSEPAETEEEEVEVTEKPQTQKKKSNIEKLLSERNQLKARLAELESKYDKSSLDDMGTLAQEMAEKIIEEKLFFRDNPDAVEKADTIKQIAKEHNFDLQTAYKVYSALETDSQTIAKKEAKVHSVSGTANRTISKKDPYSKEAMAEFDKLVKE